MEESEMDEYFCFLENSTDSRVVYFRIDIPPFWSFCLVSWSGWKLFQCKMRHADNHRLPHSHLQPSLNRYLICGWKSAYPQEEQVNTEGLELSGSF